MAARADAVGKRALDDAEILIERLLARQVHLLEDMIVRAADEDARLLDVRLLNELEIALVGADPRRDLGEFEPRILTGAEGFFILLGIEEEFRLPYEPLGAAEACHELVKIDDLLDREGRGGLLAVAEGGVRHPDLIGHIHGNMAVVEGDLGDGLVVEELAIKVGLLDVLELIAVDGILQKVRFIVVNDHAGSPP